MMTILRLPIPRCVMGRGGRTSYPFGELEVGEALIFSADDPGWTTYNGTPRHKARIASVLYAKRNGLKFTTRTLADGRFGIWRVA